MKIGQVRTVLKNRLYRAAVSTVGFCARHRGIATFVMVIVFALVGIYLARPYKMIDFSVYYYSGSSLLSGRTDLYSGDFALSPQLDYRYPPLFLLAVAPFALLPQFLAGYLWYCLCLTGIAACLFFVRGMIDLSRTTEDLFNQRDFSLSIWPMTFFAVCGYFVIALKYGNAHILFTALLFGAFYFAMKRRDAASAAMLALSITIKVLPLLALPYFAIKRRWRLLILTGIFIVILNLLPATNFGFERNFELLDNWYSHVVVDHESHEKNSWISVSLKGELLRYLTDTGSSDAGSQADRDYPAVNITNASEQTSNSIWLAISTLVYFAWLLFVRKSDDENGDDRVTGRFEQAALLDYGAIVCLILFIGPLTPKLYFIMLLLPFAALTRFVADKRFPVTKIYSYIPLLIALMNTFLPLIPGRFTQRLFLAVGVDFYIVCLVMLGIVNLSISLSRKTDY